MESESPDHQSEFQQDSQEVPPSVKIDLTPEFQRNLRNLAKRYRSIRSDIQLVIQDLETGNFVGGRITGVGEDYDVLKVRVRNRDIQKGKSAGYRLIYQVESPTSVMLLSIYSKSDQADIATQEIWKILAEFYRDT
jgi:mRNA-degrading endonuclease RelE of RelBE toxin-antitoxin system